MATPIIVKNFQVEGNEILVPSHVSIVNGLADSIKASSVASATKASQDGNGADIASTYAKINSGSTTYSKLKAGYATSAGTATSATKATQDGNGAVIANTYYKKTDTVDKASKDGQGANIVDTYAKKDGIYSQLKAGYATECNKAALAVEADGAEGIRLDNYIRDVTVSDNTLTFIRGNNEAVTRTVSYNRLASTSENGLMSATDKEKLDRITGWKNLNPENDFGGDYNNIYQTGVYLLHGSHGWNHRPANVSTATQILVVFQTAGIGGLQLLFSVSSTMFFQRSFFDGSGTNKYWTRWAYMSGTDVDTVEM